MFLSASEVSERKRLELVRLHIIVSMMLLLISALNSDSGRSKRPIVPFVFLKRRIVLTNLSHCFP